MSNVFPSKQFKTPVGCYLHPLPLISSKIKYHILYLMVLPTGGLLLGVPSLLTSLHWKWVGNSTSLGFEKLGITMLITSICWNIIPSTMIIPIFIARTPWVTLHRYGKSTMSQRKVRHVTVDSKDTSFLPLQKIPQITTVVIQTEANPQGMSGADLANLLNEARFERAWSSGSCLPQSFPPYGGIYTWDISWEYMGYNGNWDQQNEVFRVFPKSWKNPNKIIQVVTVFFKRVFGGFGV